MLTFCLSDSLEMRPYKKKKKKDLVPFHSSPCYELAPAFQPLSGHNVNASDALWLRIDALISINSGQSRVNESAPRGRREQTPYLTLARPVLGPELILEGRSTVICIDLIVILRLKISASADARVSEPGRSYPGLVGDGAGGGD